MSKQSRIKINVKQIKENPSVVSEAFFQIITLIISIFSFSFILAAASAVASPVVKAQTGQIACCEKTNAGLWCQNSLQTNCDTKLAYTPTACDSTSYCRLGCCYDSREGTCAENTPRKVCELRNGTWDPHADCSIAQCQKGCCVLGGDASLVTMVRCKKLSSFYGLQTDFRGSVKSEAECTAIAQAEDRGACVITEPEASCKFTNRAECKKLTRNNESAFKKGFICSAEELGTPCARQHHTGCIEGKDEVYWFDSCGNAENIYDADKDRSYNHGKILAKEDSCGAGQGNAKSATCGNCNYFEGSMCGKARGGIEPRPTYGDYICRDINCYDTYNENDYKHGESWCVYDGTVGNGRDLVGSRHWRHLCIQGEEKVEPCDDFRQGICVQESAQIADKNFTEAMCRANAWKLCLDYNSKVNMKTLCEDNTDCYILDVAAKATSTEGGKDKEKSVGSVCLPKVPPGFNLKSDTLSGSTYCSLATQKCDVVYQKTLKGWKCVQGCECETQQWSNALNKWCTSLGDCGLKYNIAGKYTKEGFQITKGEKEPDIASSEGGGEGFGLIGGGLTSLLGAVGSLAVFNMWKVAVSPGTAELATKIPATAAGATKEYVAGQKISLGKWMDVNFAQGSGWNVGVSVASAYLSSLIINQMFGLKGEAANIVTMVGVGTAAATSLIGMGYKGNWALIGQAGPWYGPLVWAAVAMLITAWILKSMKIGEKKTKTITFTCLPWQPPSGGEDCEKCNKEPLGGEMKPCSKYRCESLGKGCSLLNEGTGNETCVWLNRDDASAPRLKPWQDVLTKDHSYKDVKPCPPGPGCWKIERQGATEGCIKAFTPLAFGVETNEPAQCRVDYNHTAKFDDMQFFFGDNLYLYNHSMSLSLPGPAHVNAQSPELKNDGHYTMYIRCRDGNGNWNTGEMAVSFCVEAGPDTTPARVERTSILNGAPVAAGASSTPLDIFLNEPAECKWSRTDQAYENMNNTFLCNTFLEQIEWDLTYKCSTTLTKIADKQTNTYYFRCKDQPWLTTNESDRNVNKESYVFKLEGSQPLNISQVGPNGTIYGGQEPVKVALTAETINGYKYGEAKCSYGASFDTNMIEFFETGGSTHKQDLDLYTGSYAFYIQCRDAAGNTDRKTTNFSVDLDKNSPMVIRAYQDSGMLKIITDEDSDCRYGIKDCNYDFTTATDMPFSNSKEHTAEWRTDITYYIKCKDKFGNMPAAASCSMQVNAYDVGDGG